MTVSTETLIIIDLKNILKQIKKPYKIKHSNGSSINNKEGFCFQQWEDGSYLKGRYLGNKLNGIAHIGTNDGKSFIGK